MILKDFELIHTDQHDSCIFLFVTNLHLRITKCSSSDGEMMKATKERGKKINWAWNWLMIIIAAVVSGSLNTKNKRHLELTKKIINQSLLPWEPFVLEKQTMSLLPPTHLPTTRFLRRQRGGRSWSLKVSNLKIK